MLQNGHSLELIDVTQNDNSNVNFVSRTSIGNGVVASIDVIDELPPFPAGAISVALSGNGVCSAFVQTKPFYTAYHVMVLYPIKEISLAEKLFYCMCIKSNAYRYAWGRQANKTLKDIELPENVPAWLSKVEIPQLSTNNITAPAKIDVTGWRGFNLSGKDGLFHMEPCKCSNAGDLLQDGDEIEYIGAKKKNNGFIKKVKRIEELVTSGNCIIFICDGQGSVGYTNYTERDFIGSTTLSVGRNTKLNRYNALFLVTVLDRERYRYSFGRKYKTNLSKAKVLLPAKGNEPDWDYMEQYIRSLPYADRL